MRKAKSIKEVYNVEKGLRMNPNETEGTDIADPERDVETCPMCGMDKKDWGKHTGRGFSQEGETYCCRGCADSEVCTCEDSD